MPTPELTATARTQLREDISQAISHASMVEASPGDLELLALTLIPPFSLAQLPPDAHEALVESLEHCSSSTAAGVLAALTNYAPETFALSAHCALDRIQAKGFTAPLIGAPQMGSIVSSGRKNERIIVATIWRDGQQDPQVAVLFFDSFKSRMLLAETQLFPEIAESDVANIVAGLRESSESISNAHLQQSIQAALDHSRELDVVVPNSCCEVLPILARALTGDALGFGPIEYDEPEEGEESEEPAPLDREWAAEALKSAVGEVFSEVPEDMKSSPYWREFMALNWLGFSGWGEESYNDYVDVLIETLEARGDLPATGILEMLAQYQPPWLDQTGRTAIDRIPKPTSLIDRPELGYVGAVDESNEYQAIPVVLLRDGGELAQMMLVEIQFDRSGPMIIDGEITPPVPTSDLTPMIGSFAFGSDEATQTAAAFSNLLRRAIENMRNLNIPALETLASSIPLLACALTGDPYGYGRLEYEASEPSPYDAPDDEPYVFDVLEDEDGFHEAKEELTERFANYAETEFDAVSPIRMAAKSDVESLLNWKGNYADGRLVHWQEADVAKFLLDYCPRKVAASDEAMEVTPDCIAAFFEFLAKEGLLVGHSLKLTDLCRELKPQYIEASRDPANWGIAKSMFTSMLGDGVDINDRDGIDNWMTEFNDRPREDRDRILGPSVDQMSDQALSGYGNPIVRRKNSDKARRSAAKAARKRNRK